MQQSSTWRHWTVLLGCFIGLAVSVSSIFTFPLGLYMKAVTTEFGWSRTQFSATLSIVAVGNAIMFPVSGWAADRFGAVRCIIVGLTAGCLACAALALVHSYSAFIALSCLASMTGCLSLYPAYFKLLRGWFDRHLGLALAVAVAGISVGVAGFSFLIQSTIDAGGWRNAFVLSSALALIIGLTNTILLMRENRGALPVTERLYDDGGTTFAGSTLGEAIRTSDFWLFSISFVLIVIAGAGPNLHLPALIADRGGSPRMIASAAGTIVMGSFFGRIVSGLLLDRLSVRIVSAGFFLAQAAGILMLWTHVAYILPAAFLIGTAQGAELDIMGFVIARRFGRLAYGRIFGCFFAISQLGIIVGPLSMAAIFDATHSYDLALLLYSVLPLVAIFLTMRASPIAVSRHMVSSGEAYRNAHLVESESPA